jgi:hypothetical protein
VETLYRSDITTWLSVDANPHRARVVIVADGLILGGYEASTGPRQAGRILQYLQHELKPLVRPKLVGRLYDRWPSQLHTALVLQYGPVTWINPNLLTSTLYEVERWRRLCNSYRGLFFAVCAEEATKRELSPFFDNFDLLTTWKNAVLHDLNANYTI